jgi:iron complex transport system substrate-binding protein
MQQKRSIFTRLASTVILGGTLALSSSAWAEKIVDIAGREVELPKKVDRILLGEGRLFHAVALLEGKQPLARIAGWQGDFRKLDTQSYAIYKAKFPEIDNIPLVGNTTADSISAEKVLTLNPDIAIFGLSGHGPGRSSELVTQLEKSGVPVIFVDFRSLPLKNTVPSMRILGKALQREEVAERYINFYQENVEKVTKITKDIPEKDKPTVFIELKAGTSEDCCGTAGKGNMGDFIDLAGGNNIAKDLLPGVLGTVNLEKVIMVNPDIYIASGAKAPGSTTPGLVMGPQATAEETQATAKPILARKGISSLKAVVDGRTYAVWHNYYNSPYNVVVVQAFAKWFYPELFNDLDPRQTQKALYDEFLAIEPTGTTWLELNNK